jgi:hypothetical protein
MSLKSVAFAALGLLCSTGAALAQGASPEPTPPPDAAQLRQLQGVRSQAAGAAISNGGGVIARATTGPTASIVNGWNYFHASNCQYYFDGANNWVYVYSPEGLFFYSPNNDIVAQTFLTGCVNGNWEAVFVINAATGAFNYIYTYSFK